MNRQKIFNEDRFVKALVEQDNEIVERYLQAGLDPNIIWYRKSYVKLAVEHLNVEGLTLLLQYGADPNLDLEGLSPLQIANGAMKNISASFVISKILISYGATKGAFFLNKLSTEQIKELSVIRKKYVKDGFNLVNHIKDYLDSKLKLQTEDFFNKINYQGYAELYTTLDSQYQSMVDKDISTIQEKFFTNHGILEKSYNWIKSWSPSIESEPYREVHSLLLHATNIIKSYGTLNEENSILGAINPIE